MNGFRGNDSAGASTIAVIAQEHTPDGKSLRVADAPSSAILAKGRVSEKGDNDLLWKRAFYITYLCCSRSYCLFSLTLARVLHVGAPFESK